MWNPAKPDSLAPPEGGGAADFSVPRTDRSRLDGIREPRARLVVLLLVIGAVAWVTFLYRETALAMEAIWSRSGTFAHGYLVAPISFWLIWRRREVLARLPLRPSFLGVLAGLVCGFAWLAAELSSVDSVGQSAFIGMLISAVWALAGTAVTRSLAFPLSFLFFCVPFGEFLFPTMMDHTADFIVAALRLSGVPVFIEGRSLVIPSGHWQVVEGCSGVRYLIASIVVGSLYAYLNYRSNLRRVVFTALAVVAPILANWLRAYGVVMLGHISDNRLATGVDHLIYGWVFFGIVMLGLFWIGARWQEPDESPALALAAGPSPARSGARQPTVAVFAVTAVLVSTVFSMAVPAVHWVDAQGQHGPVVIAPTIPTSGWGAGEISALPGWAPHYGGMSAQAYSAWSKGGATVGLYLGYYRDQEPGRELINSENKIIKSKDPVWTFAGYGDVTAYLPGGPVKVRSTEILGPGGRLLLWHWYWIGGRVTSNDYVAKVLLVLAKLAGRGDDSAAAVIYTPVAEDGRAESQQRLEDFAREMGPAVAASLAATMGR